MQENTSLLLSSRFYAYAKEGRPWGLPNHLWSEAPHLLVLFDQLCCDQAAFEAEEKGYYDLGWEMSGLFLKLKKEGVLIPMDLRDIVCSVSKPRPRLRIPGIDTHYSLKVQQQLGFPIFDWDRKIAKRASTLSPRSTNVPIKYDRSARKLTDLWSIIAETKQIVPSLNTLTGQAGEAYKKALELQEPFWKQLERIEISVDEYINNLTRWKHLYEKIDKQLRPVAQENFEKFLRFRDKTKRERTLIKPLIDEAFDNNKELATYATKVQFELSKAVPSLFPAVAKATGKCLIGMAILAAPWVAEGFGITTPINVKVAGGVVSGKTLASGAKSVQSRITERRKANPLRFMVKAARSHGL
ncbi:hypothetical protein ACFL5Z_01410 [Planctomycetota bacterium]